MNDKEMKELKILMKKSSIEIACLSLAQLSAFFGTLTLKITPKLKITMIIKIKPKLKTIP